MRIAHPTALVSATFWHKLHTCDQCACTYSRNKRSKDTIIMARQVANTHDTILTIAGTQSSAYCKVSQSSSQASMNSMPLVPEQMTIFHSVPCRWPPSRRSVLVFDVCCIAPSGPSHFV